MVINSETLLSDFREDLRPRCHVSFSIIGSALDFDGISAAMNQVSAKTVRAGTRTALGLRTEDEWSIAATIDPLKPIKEHLHWLHSQLEPHVRYLTDLPKTARCRVYIGFTLSQEQNGFQISPDYIRLFASLNATVDMYIIVNFGDDSDG